MTDRAPQGDLGDSVKAARERAGAERYQRYQRKIRSGRARARKAARRPKPTFVERVARLLNTL